MFLNKTVIVTGGAKGIGRAIALKFAALHANVAVNYRSAEPTELADEIARLGGRCFLHKADVSNFDEAKRLVDAVTEAFGVPDVLVNNAGITRDSLIIRMKESEFDEVIATNLKGAFNMTRHVSGLMAKSKSGAIINISSVVGVTGNIGQANYAASKAGLIGMTKSVARELASRGVTCNAVAPGFIETDMTAKLPEQIRVSLLNTIPAKAFGKADDVAEAVAFLAANRYITGQVLNVDGGMVM